MKTKMKENVEMEKVEDGVRDKRRAKIKRMRKRDCDQNARPLLMLCLTGTFTVDFISPSILLYTSIRLSLTGLVNSSVVFWTMLYLRLKFQDCPCL